MVNVVKKIGTYRGKTVHQCGKCKNWFKVPLKTLIVKNKGIKVCEPCLHRFAKINRR